jgi:hypothetical protein
MFILTAATLATLRFHDYDFVRVLTIKSDGPTSFGPRFLLELDRNRFIFL